MQEKRPTFLGVGAHKAGTSWLYKQLLRHPDIWLPPIKELHFFDRSVRYPSSNNLATASPLARLTGSERWQRPLMLKNLGRIGKRLRQGQFNDARWWMQWTFGHYDERWYANLFAAAAAYQACGEITPSYSILQQREVAQIHTINPDMKIIMMLRNPIERAWSAVRFNVDTGRVKLNLDSEKAVIEAINSPQQLRRGDYEHMLDTYLACFDPAQILVCFYDAIALDPVALMANITTFLGVAPFEERAIDNRTRINSSTSRRLPKGVEHYLQDYYGPMIERLSARLGSYASTWCAAPHPRHLGIAETAAPATPRLPALHPIAATETRPMATVA